MKDTPVAPSCTNSGLTEGEHCTVCGTVTIPQETIPETGHVFGEWTTATEPTCTEKGTETRSCHCGEVENREISAIGHDFEDSFTVDVEPTLEFTGSKSRHCKACDEKTDITEIPKLTPSVDSSEMFSDIPRDAWYKKSVDFAVSKGYMNGIGGGKFSPDGVMTRAMVVTVLYRIEGEPEVSGNVPFTDIEADWYRNAVAWAYQNAIVKGTSDTKFSPDGEITREQLATILYRYASFKGYDTSTTASLDSFPDADSTSSWALDAMKWAYAEGLITGASKGGKILLDPLGIASRSQVATIFMRFDTKKR